MTTTENTLPELSKSELKRLGIVSKRRYFDFTSRLHYEERKSGKLLIKPFITARRYAMPETKKPSWQLVPFWLEWRAIGLPDETDIARQPSVSPLQTFTDYDGLPPLRLPADACTFNKCAATQRATAIRIPDGDVVIIRIGEGCLWTMIPKQ